MSTTQKIWQSVCISVFVLLAGAQAARADSVAQVQTTKYFAPETVAMLKQRVADVANGVPGATLGFKNGDTVSYIIQFTPIANTSTIGAGGYITDYIPIGTQVTGAWFVQPDGLGGFYQVSPPTSAKMAADNPLGAYTGWTMDAATLAICTAAGRTAANCTGRFPNLVADTGIFYSNDPRTQVFTDPSTDGRVQEWAAPTGNGYSVCPVRGMSQLVTIMGGTVTSCAAGGASTHNYWDAAMTTAFGTASASMPPSPTPGNAKIIAAGTGPTPFNAGSPVAGPDAGYQLDYTGNVGPWHRVSYPGSTVGPLGLPASGTAIANPCTTCITVGTMTSAGVSFPLPADTNAVRWAAGRLVVGTQSYVKISLQLTSSPPATGLVNNSEVFGGDGSPEDGMLAGGGGGGGNSDSPWVYHVPSVASNVSTLYILKEVVCLYDATGNCIASNGANLPLAGTPATGGPKVRYRISYINTNNGTQHNVTICDQLPDGARLSPAATITYAGVTQVSATPNVGAPSSPAIAACKFTGAGATFNYPTIPVLAGGGAGIIEYDVQYPLFAALNVNDSIVNGAKAVSTEIPTGVTSYAPSNLVTAIAANLQISKSVSPASANKGDTVTYTINIANTGGTAAGLTTLTDTLPGVASGAGVPVGESSRFHYIATSSIAINGTPLSGVTAVMTPPAVPGTINKELVTWTFPAGTTLPASGLLTLKFTVTLGNLAYANSLVYGTGYANVAATINYTGGGGSASIAAGYQPTVTVSIPNLTVAKTIDCVYVGATCNPGSYPTGSSIPTGLQKIRYKIVATNPEAAAQTITLTDTLPTQVGANAISNMTVDGVSTTPPTNPAGGSTVTLLNAVSLPGLSSSTVYMDVQTTSLAAAAVVINSATISSTQRTAAGGVAIPASTVSATATALTITKTSNIATVAPGGTVIYTITVTNPTAAAITLTNVVDTLPLPTAGTITCAAAATCTNSIMLDATSLAFAPTLTAAGGGTGQKVTWAFTTPNNSLAAGKTLTIIFTATYSATVPRGNTNFLNTATVIAAAVTSSTGPVAPVTVPYNTLSISKAVVTPVSASIAPNSAVTYAITVTNTGTQAVPVTSVVDSLPSATAGLISYTSTSSVVVASGAAGTNAVTTTAAAVGVQQQITWTFTGASINPGSTMVITFVAQFGLIPTGTTYYNDVKANYTGGLTATQSATNLAPVTVPTISKITKTINCVYSGATCVGPYVDGTAIPVNAKLGYKIVYENLSALPASGIVITDILPTQTAANSISNLIINGTPTAAPPSAAGGATVTLLSGGTLAASPPSSTGTITFDVLTTATAGAGVTNTANIVSNEDPTGMSSAVTAAASGGNLTVTKAVTTATSSTTAQGGTVSYTISVKNDGVADATLNTLVDTLPGVANAAGATWRFNYAATSAMTLNGSTITPANTVVQVNPGSPAITNNQVVTWTLTGGLVIPAGQTYTLTFTATVGSAVPKGAAAPGATYYNSVTANYTGGLYPTATATGQAPVLVSFYSLTMNKTISCVYSGASCVAYVPGSPIPTNAKVRYQLSYQNLAAAAQTVTVNDTLPASTTAAGNLYVASGPDIRPSTPVLSANGAAAGAARGADVALTAIAGSSTVKMTAVSLPANTSGSMYIDVQSTAASNASVTNCASISTVATDTCATPSAIDSSVTATALDLAQLVVTKTTSTQTLAPGNRATYTISIQNTGLGATNSLQVLDFLPFDGGTADANKHLNYFATTGYTLNGSAITPTPTITTNTPPLVAPFGANSNQQQVQWNFGNYVLAAGATLTITFTADAGANMTPGSYSNSAQAQYTSVTTSLVATVTNTAPINLVPHVTLNKSIIAVCSGAGCTPTAYTPGAMLPPNAKIRYQIVYTNSSATTAQTNVVLSDLLPTQTAAAAVSNVVIVSGPITAPSAGALSGLAAGGATLTFPTLASLPASGTGTITLDVQTNAPLADTVSNTAKVVSAEDVNGNTNVSTASVTSLSVSKSIDCVYSGATCTSGSYVAGTVIPVNAKVRYKIIYSSAATAQSNVVLSDLLPSQTAAAPVSNVAIVSGPITAPAPATLAALAAGGATLTFPTLASLPASTSGTITLDVQTNAPAASTVSNTAKLVSTEDTNGVTSTVTTAATSLTVSKSIDCVYSGAICTAGSYVAGVVIPANAKVRYKIIYSNASATTAQSSVVLSDLLPSQTAAAPVSNVVIVSGLITAPAAGTLSALAAGGATLAFPTLGSLLASASGTITLDVLTNAAASNVVSNTAKVVSTEDATGVSSTVAATVSLLTLSKTTSTPNVVLGGTATYTISIKNNSGTPTTSLQVYDFLPYSGAMADPNKRFVYVSTSGYTGGLPAPTITFPVTPTVAPYNANINQQQVLWDFGGYALAAGATVTITFTATVGNAIPTASYTNSAGYQYTSAAGPGSMNADGLAAVSAFVAPVLSFTKLVYVLSDPVNGTTNPKFIPGSVAVYTLLASNTGGAADNNSIVITDPVPANTLLYLKDLGAVGSGPVAFTDGATSSGLTYTKATDLSFSNDGGTAWSAVPTFDATTGCDTTTPAITNIRVNPKGAFAGSSAPSPSFQLNFRVCVK